MAGIGMGAPWRGAARHLPALGLGLGLGLALLGADVRAFEAAPGAAIDSIGPIPAGSLDQVLRAYTLASGVLLAADGRLTRDVSSPGLAAAADPAREPARDLAQILAGTGLVAEHQADGVFLLRRPAAADRAARPAIDAAPVQTMPQVTVADGDIHPYADTGSRFAIKTATPLMAVPQAVSIVGANQIRDQGMQSMADLLQYVAGVEASQGEGNRDNAVFRGYNSSADFFLNGVRDDVQYFRDFYNIDSVEVLKGPNAMAMGRGGSGGVVNRVGKQALWRDGAEASLTLGSWDQRRASVDANRVLGADSALRLNAVDETADSFRDGVWLARRGVSPALAWRDGASLFTLNAEHFKDRRSTDRGVPSYDGRPVASAPSTFFGNADLSYNWVAIDALSGAWERTLASGLSLSGLLSYAYYDKYYQNVFAGAVDPGGETVRMLGYGSATKRANLFFQSAVSGELVHGSMVHRLAAGIELGRQRTSNYRTTAYFDTLGLNVRYVTVPVAAPSVDLPVNWRASSTDIDNKGTADMAAVYLQDQLELSPRWQLVAGLRYEAFKVDFLDLRKQAALGSLDRPLSPRLGLVYQPVPALSLYVNTSRAYAPRAGEQLSSLTAENQALTPERVRNVELGAKWALTSSLAASVALYDLKRGNVMVPDPVNLGATVMVDGQRGQGFELELDGRLAPGWTVKAAYAWQNPTVSATQSATAQLGARMPFVPRNALSVWSRYQLRPALGVALGLVGRDYSYSSTSNLVRLPGYARLDGAVYYRLGGGATVRANLENLLDRAYYKSAFSDNNISPGAPRSLRLTLDLRY